MKGFDFARDVLPLKNKLYRLALRITLSSQEAEDIVQDTMIRIWKMKDQIAKVDSLEAMAMTICHNLSLDRSEKKDAHSENLDETLEPVTTIDTPHENLVRQERLKIVKELFNNLQSPYREVMQLRDIEGKSYKEIAEIMSISEDQVRVNLFRARQKIRNQYIEIENYGL